VAGIDRDWWRGAIGEIAKRFVLSELLGDPAASALLVVFPSMRFRRIVAMGFVLFTVRSIVIRPLRTAWRLTASEAD